MLTLKERIKERIEIALIRHAANILINRNVSRAPMVSRRDNNDMWFMGERLHVIANRIVSRYEMYVDGQNEEQRRIAAAMRFCRGISTKALERVADREDVIAAMSSAVDKATIND